MKLTKEIIKKLIMEDNVPNPNTGGGRVYSGSPTSQYMQNYRAGKAPDNNNKEQYEGRPPYETGEIETHIEGGEVYRVVQGANEFELIFDEDDETLSHGMVRPIGEYRFNIVNGAIDWESDLTPPHVRNGAELSRQILDYSGRED